MTLEGQCDLLEEGVVAKLADDLFRGANTLEGLLCNWRKVLQALQNHDLKLCTAKTVIGPKSTTILGWKWQMGTIEASPHRITCLASWARPASMQGLLHSLGHIKSYLVFYQNVLVSLLHWMRQAI